MRPKPTRARHFEPGLLPSPEPEQNQNRTRTRPTARQSCPTAWLRCSTLCPSAVARAWLVAHAPPLRLLLRCLYRTAPYMKHKHAPLCSPAAPRPTIHPFPACQPVPQEAQEHARPWPPWRRAPIQLRFWSRQELTLVTVKHPFPPFICLSRASTATCRRSITRARLSSPSPTLSSRTCSRVQAISGNS